MQKQKKQERQSRAAEALGLGRDLVAQRVDNNELGSDSVKELTSLMDVYFRDRLREIWTGKTLPENSSFCVVAVGGYGRRELCLHSDVDILVLYDKRIPPEALDLAQSLFYPLWDLGLDLGHGFRSMKECLSLARKDFEVLASLLDARLVDGNPELFASFMKRFTDKVAIKKAPAFSTWLTKHNKERRERFGDASVLLEPDLKEGVGGLRDYHQILWLGRLYYGQGTVDELLHGGHLTEAQAHVLSDVASFLLQVRTLLHARSGRRNDKLHLPRQEEMARILGYEDRDGRMAVETFLTRLHRDMVWLKALHVAFIGGLGASRQESELPATSVAPGVCCRGESLEFDLERGYPHDPLVLVEIFGAFARTGLPLSWDARGFVSAHLYLVKDELSASPQAVGIFMDILRSGRAASVLEAMFETGFLGAFVPEFGKVQDLVQFDTYHIYPVGRHTLQAMAALEAVPAKHRRIRALAAEVGDPLVMLLGAFFHDIGKGLGGGHSEKGADIARNVLDRWGVPEDLVSDVCFLVREHLSLFEVATRRDLEDESVVASCAQIVRSEDLLRLLMLLTWADAQATGPGVWKKWTAGLVWELYQKVVRILRRGRFASEQAVQTTEQTRSELRELAKDILPASELEVVMGHMPLRYFMTLGASEIAQHLQMVLRLRELVAEDRRQQPVGRIPSGQVVVQAKALEDRSCWEVTLAAMDCPGLFATIAGVLSLHGVNIMSAECFQWSDGTVVDVFTVSDPLDSLSPNVLWDRVGKSVQDALSGQLDLNSRLGAKRRSPTICQSLDVEPEVALHNKDSDFYTIIEITAADRIGLLYDVGSVLHGLQLSVRLAKIATYGDRVADVFYVRERAGGKATGVAREREIMKALLDCLQEACVTEASA